MIPRDVILTKEMLPAPPEGKTLRPENFEDLSNHNRNVDLFLRGKAATPFESSEVQRVEKAPLSQEDKDTIKIETGWSEEIVDAIGSMEEYEVYKNADLVEDEIDGKKCLIKKDLDMNQIDDFGRSNKERMEIGLAPIDKNGETIELHHIGQKADSPLAELTTSEHRGKGNDTILHDKTKPTEIDRVAFTNERNAHWHERGTA